MATTVTRCSSSQVEEQVELTTPDSVCVCLNTKTLGEHAWTITSSRSDQTLEPCGTPFVLSSHEIPEREHDSGLEVGWKRAGATKAPESYSEVKRRKQRGVGSIQYGTWRVKTSPK